MTAVCENCACYIASYPNIIPGQPPDTDVCKMNPVTNNVNGKRYYKSCSEINPSGECTDFEEQS